MAGLILGSVLDSITGQAVSLVSHEIGLACGVKLELEKLQTTVSNIGGVLREAEKRQVEAEDVKQWLKKLKGVAYDADDLLDDYSTEALRRRINVKGRGKQILNAVRIFFSSSNQLIYATKLAHRVKEIREKFDAISNDRGFQLEGSSSQVGNSVENRMTYPFESKPYVIGRDKDKKEVIEFLLNPHFDENITILPIVGLGGLGKTTLARLVFNDERVGEYFELKLWVYVSTDFIVEDILRKLLRECTQSREYANLDMNELQKKLGEELGRKRFLIVLDDMWNENRDKWLDLQGLLVNGERGSKILATTRTIRVARTMTPNYYELGGLPEDESLTLLMEMAMKQEHEWRNQRLEDIAREIVRKCVGVPLAIRTMGRLLLFTRNTEEDWLSFKNNDLSRTNQEEGDIMPTLRLSYDFLPSHLKQCFGYCGLFPKDYELRQSELICLWIAHGFIKSMGNRKTLEEVGHEYFAELVLRCFFQDIREDLYGNIYGCKMHDLLHDLARLVEKDNCISMDRSDVEKIPEGVRHVSVIGNMEDYEVKEFERDMRIRSLLLIDVRRPSIGISHVDVSSFGNLRALRLRDLNVKAVEKSIGKLKHLRSLDLSHNIWLRFLPNSISRLCNLETLNLRCCVSLEALPAGITKLVNLRQLDVGGCSSLTHMPKGIGNLSNLQTLTAFAVGEKGNSNAARLNELSNLTRLRGELSIEHLERLGSSEVAASFSIEKFRHLELSWDFFGDKEYNANDEEVLERFRPHSDLKGLVINGYKGAMLSSWVSQFQTLIDIRILGCDSCTHLPPLDHLPFLKRVSLACMLSLEWIELSGSGTPHQSFFPSLEEIKLDFLPVFEGWKTRRGNDDIQEEEADEENGSPSLLKHATFSDKVKVSISECPRFLYKQGQLVHLAVTTMKQLHQLLKENVVRHAPHLELPTRMAFTSMSSTTLSVVTSLIIYEMEDVEQLPLELFPSLPTLQSLEVSNCPRLKSLPVGTILRYLTALEKLGIYRCKELDLSIEDKDGDGGSEEQMPDLQLQGHNTLISLDIVGINKMESFPGWFEYLSNLKDLSISSCDGLKSLPVSLILQHLTSLETLKLYHCPNLELAGESEDQVDMPNLQFSLRVLLFVNMEKLKTLPWWIRHLNKLEDLELTMCSNMEALPEWFPHLTSLKRLEVGFCGEEFSRRCKRGIGEDWPKISHIQDVNIY